MEFSSARRRVESLVKSSDERAMKTVVRKLPRSSAELPAFVGVERDVAINFRHLNLLRGDRAR